MYFSKYGGTLGTNGSLSFLFSHKGIFQIPQGDQDEEAFVLEMIDAGAEDVELEEGVFTVSCAFDDFGVLNKKLEQMNITVENAELQRIPKNTTNVDPETA